MVMVVPPGPFSPGWAYTVGLHAHDLPELIVVGGMSLEDQYGMLHELAERMRENGAPEPGDRDPDFLVGFEVAFVEVDETAGEEFAVAHLVQSDFRALQVVWPDLENRFPWESDYEIPVGQQPLLGSPPE